MKKTLIAIVVLLLSNQLKGQETNQLNEMIISSINMLIADRQSDVDNGTLIERTEEKYVLKEGLPSDFPFDRLPNIVFLGSDFRTFSKALRREIRQEGVGVFSVNYRLISNQILITIYGKGMENIRRNRLFVGLGSWSRYSYEYSCKKREWEFQRVEYGGI